MKSVVLLRKIKLVGAVGATVRAVRVHGEARSAVYLLVAVKFAVDSHWTQVGEGL